MLLRICLILTIIAGLGTAYVGFFPVQDIIKTTRASRDDFHNKLTAETAAHKKTKKELADTKEQLAKTTSKLTETTAQLAEANSKNAELDKQNTDLTDKLTKATARADADDQQLEQWRVLGLTPVEIKGVIAERDELKKVRAVITGENKILAGTVKTLQEQIDDLIGTQGPPPLPPRTQGESISSGSQI